jgi:phage terminase small subunit
MAKKQKSSKPPEPASHLSVEMRKFWAEVVGEYELEAEALLTLQVAAEAWDRAQQARELVTKEGLVLANRRHPALETERQCHATFLKAIRALGLDIVAPGPIGRPPGK